MRKRKEACKFLLNRSSLMPNRDLCPVICLCSPNAYIAAVDMKEVLSSRSPSLFPRWLSVSSSNHTLDMIDANNIGRYCVGLSPALRSMLFKFIAVVRAGMFVWVWSWPLKLKGFTFATRHTLTESGSHDRHWNYFRKPRELLFVRCLVLTPVENLYSQQNSILEIGAFLFF